MKRRIISFLLTLTIIVGCMVPTTAQAAVPTGFTGISRSYVYAGGKKVKTPKADLITVSRDESVTASSYKYATFALEGKTYAITKTGKLKTNMICGAGENKFYYDVNGVQVNDPVIQAAVDFVSAHGGKRTKAAAKLRNCYNYLAKSVPGAADKTSELFDNEKLTVAASAFLKQGQTGDSFLKASALAYVARVLGYESQVVGCVISDGDGGFTPHGYTMVKHGRTWYIYDAAKKVYKSTVKKYPYKVDGAREALTLTLKDGAASYTGVVSAMKDVKAILPLADEDAPVSFQIKDGFLYQGEEKYVGHLITVPASQSVTSKSYTYFSMRLNGRNYVFDENAQMITNRIVGIGIYKRYYGPDGVMVVDDVIQHAIDFVFLHGGSNNTVAAKLKNCEKYLGDRNHYGHSGQMNTNNCTPKLLPGAAMEMLGNGMYGHGNCVSWASAFVYVARVLGYDGRMVEEHRTNYSGDGYGAHGYCHILDKDGVWKRCDPNQEYKGDQFMKDINYHFYDLRTLYPMTVEDGVVTWTQGETKHT